MPPPPSSIATASPDLSEATEAKPISNSRRMKEQADISSTRNGDANPTTKLEQAQIHCNIHKNPDNSIEGKPIRDDNEGTDIAKNTSADTLNPDTIDSSNPSSNAGTISIARTARTTNTNAADSSSSSKHNTADINDYNSGYNHKHTFDPGGVNTSKCNFVHDPGGNNPNTEDGASSSTCTSNASCTADTHCIYDRDRDKTGLPPFEVNPAIQCARAIGPNDTPSPHPTDNLPALLHRDSKCTDEAQRLSLEHQEHPLDFDFDLAQPSTSNITHTPPASRPDSDSAHSSNSIIDAARTFNTINPVSLVSTARSFDTYNTDVADTSNINAANTTSNARTSNADAASNSNSNRTINADAASSASTARSFDTYNTDVADTSNINAASITNNARTINTNTDADSNSNSKSKSDSRSSASTINTRTSNADTAASNSNSIRPIAPDFTRTPPAQRFNNAADNNANNNSSSSHDDTIDADADTRDNSSTDITPLIRTSPSTTTRDIEREREYEHACIPPFDASTQVPPVVTPPSDKPEEPPPACPMDKAASPPTPKSCKATLDTPAPTSLAPRQLRILTTNTTSVELTQEGQNLNPPGGVRPAQALALESNTARDARLCSTALLVLHAHLASAFYPCRHRINASLL